MSLELRVLLAVGLTIVWFVVTTFLAMEKMMVTSGKGNVLALVGYAMGAALVDCGLWYLAGSRILVIALCVQVFFLVLPEMIEICRRVTRR